MVSRTHLNDDGGIQLPLELREHLHLHPGDALIIEERDGTVLLRRDDEAASLGQAGRTLASRVIEPEDFSDWEETGA